MSHQQEIDDAVNGFGLVVLVVAILIVAIFLFGAYCFIRTLRG